MSSETKYSLYIIPHPDDWLFFAASQIQKDFLAGIPVVLIYVTAGDAGRDETWWKARENGALAASGTKLCKSHFLRLPDGMEIGNGSSRYGNQSLTHLKRSNRTIQSVDKTITYHSWEQFCSKLAEIISSETNGVHPNQVWIHAPEYDPSRNPNDHPDHIAIAEASRTIIQGRYPTSWWISYWSSYCPPNLSGKELEWKRDRFLAYSKTIEKLTGDPPNEKEWQCWGNRSYFRKISQSGLELKNYDSHYLQVEQFQQILNVDRSALYQQSWAAEEETSRQIRNQLTGHQVLLSTAGKIVWQKLKKPTRFEEIAQILSGSDPKGSATQNAVDFLNALLKIKLIYKI